jgi:hypothetical protein
LNFLSNGPITGNRVFRIKVVSPPTLPQLGFSASAGHRRNGFEVGEGWPTNRSRTGKSSLRVLILHRAQPRSQHVEPTFRQSEDFQQRIRKTSHCRSWFLNYRELGENLADLDPQSDAAYPLSREKPNRMDGQSS